MSADAAVPFTKRDGHNLAECAIVAAKVYEAFQWPRYDPRSKAMHVPDAEALLQVLHDLGRKALEQKGTDHFSEPVGHLRFLAYADDDGDDSYVCFYISIGHADGWDCSPSQEGEP